MGRRKKLDDPPKAEPEAIKISQKVTLQPGDKIRVTQGPYFVCNSGKVVNLGHRGKGIYLRAEKNNIWVKFSDRSDLIYIGPEYVSEATGSIMRPHKISKIREKKEKT